MSAVSSKTARSCSQVQLYAACKIKSIYCCKADSDNEHMNSKHKVLISFATVHVPALQT